MSAGVAAINIDGMTLHKWAGVGLGNEGIKVMLGRAFGKRKEYKQTRVLIIDEISMVLSFYPFLPAPTARTKADAAASDQVGPVRPARVHRAKSPQLEEGAREGEAIRRHPAYLLR